MVGRTNAVSPAGGGAETITGKIPASSSWSLYNFTYTNDKCELVKLYKPSAQTISDIYKNTVVFCSSSVEAGVADRKISGGGTSLFDGSVNVSEDSANILPGDFAKAFLVTGDFEIT